MAPKKAASAKARSPSPAKSTRSSSRGGRTSAQQARDAAAQVARESHASRSPARGKKATQSAAADPTPAPITQVFFAPAWQALEDLESGALDPNGNFDSDQVVSAWNVLQNWPHVNGNARAADDENMKAARPIYRKIKKLIRPYFGSDYEDMLTRQVDEDELYQLAEQHSADAAHPSIEDNSVPLSVRRPSAASSRSPSRGAAPPTRFARTASASPAKGRAPSAARSSATTAAGRVTKPTSRATSQSTARPLRAGSQGPSGRYQAPRAPSAGSSLNVSRTRSRSPLKSGRISRMRDYDVEEMDDYSSGSSVSIERIVGPRMPDYSIMDDPAEDQLFPRKTRTHTHAPTQVQALDGDAMDLDSDGGIQLVSGFKSPQSYSQPQPSAEGRGTVVSHANPERIRVMGTIKPNPFFETMPAPETWHRRMPAFFPFGETPAMEAHMSRQIDEDLKRGMEDMKARRQSNSTMLQKAGRFAQSVGELLTSPLKSAPERKFYPSAWDLPHVTEQELQNAMPRRGSARTNSLGVRKPSHALSSGSRRRPYDGMMSGGLGALEGTH